MNIVTTHRKIKMWLDQVNTRRFTFTQIDQAINFAVDDEVDKFIGEGRYKGTLASVELNSESKQVLNKLIKIVTIDSTSDMIFGSDNLSVLKSKLSSKEIKKIIAVSIYYSNEWHRCIPATNEDIINDFNGNVFVKPTISYPEKIYFTETETSLVFYPNSFVESSPSTGKVAVEKIKVEFLEYWDRITIGTEFTTGGTGSIKYNTFIVYSDRVSYRATNYLMGEEIPIVSNVTFWTDFTYGTVVMGYNNIPMPENRLEKIAQKAAIMLASTVGAADKIKAIFAGNNF